MVYTHTRAIYNGLIREFLAAMPRICENCGATSPSIVRDGFLKLFEVPIKSKSKQFTANAMPVKSALDFLTVSQLAKMEGVEEKEPEFAEAEMEEEEAPALEEEATAKMKWVWVGRLRVGSCRRWRRRFACACCTRRTTTSST